MNDRIAKLKLTRYFLAGGTGSISTIALPVLPIVNPATGNVLQERDRDRPRHGL
jgi:hypothetical protein